MKEMGVADKVSIKNVHRLRVLDATKEGGRKKANPGIRVELNNDESKRALFGSLGKWKRTETNKTIRFVQDYPAFLRAENDTLEKIAYDLRNSSDNNIKTRIVLRGVSLVLLCREGKEGKWEPYEHQSQV